MHAIAASQRLATVFKSLLRGTRNAWQLGKSNIHIPLVALGGMAFDVDASTLPVAILTGRTGAPFPTRHAIALTVTTVGRRSTIHSPDFETTTQHGFGRIAAASLTTRDLHRCGDDGRALRRAPGREPRLDLWSNGRCKFMVD